MRSRKRAPGAWPGVDSKIPPPRRKGVFAAHYFDAGMVQPETEGVQTVVGGGQIVEVEMDLGLMPRASSAVAAEHVWSIYIFEVN